ncbi:ribosomal protein L9 [Thermanaerovibrio velox DSM 12556]|uniref:Large ribosomal subunit protein bL9 n=1 Tax=Thermanaerovibrio velox DSM 12556 TaxID=926567 RepID=H0USH9_9BACT|nr:50S ribosomal protein L9 [Thermanaerovibrio velox]EHM10268.1 ribosomal protein L9 [Thermanaerovibrio velox DSM 12556]
MKAVLKEDVSKLGRKGDVVEVSDGYFRNFLLPRGLAEEATAGKLKEIEEKRRNSAAREAKLMAQAKENAAALGGKRVVVKASAGESGKLFGAVTAQQVADAIEAQHGIKVDKRDVKMDQVKQVGEYRFKVRLYPGVEAEMLLSVEA